MWGVRALISHMLIKQQPSDCQLRAHSLSAEGDLIVGNSFTEYCFSDKHCKSFVTRCFPLSPRAQFPVSNPTAKFSPPTEKGPRWKNLNVQNGYGKNSILSLCIVKPGKSQDSCSPKCEEFWQGTAGRILHTAPLRLHLHEALLAKHRETLLLQATEQMTAQQDREEVDREMMGQLLHMLPVCMTEMSTRVLTASRESLSHSSLDFAFHIYHVELMSCFHTQPHKEQRVQNVCYPSQRQTFHKDTLSECLLEEASAKQIIWRGAGHCARQDSTLHVCGYLCTRHLFCRRSGAGEACAVCMLWPCQ